MRISHNREGVPNGLAQVFAVIIALFAATFAGNTFAAEITGKVVGVHDGDTITLLADDRIQVKVRLAGIDAPELKQPFGNASKQELSRLVFGKEVRVEDKGKDRYGRTLGDVFVGVEWANEAQVRNGMAWVYLQYSRDPKLLEAERQARQGQRGLWRDKDVAPPWEWRRERAAARRRG